MADPLGAGAGIVGVIGLAIQIMQTVVQFGMDWKDAPDNIKTFMAELGALQTILSETKTNILLNFDFVEAFQNRSSLLLSQIGPNASPTTDTNVMLEICRKELTSLLKELKKRGQGHKLGWERFKGAFLAKNTRQSVENLSRQCQTLNIMLSIDATVLGATTFKEVKEARKEHREWHQTEAETSSAIKEGVDQSNQRQQDQQRQHEQQVILDWLTEVNYATEQHDFISRRQAGTGQWLLSSAKFQTWLETSNQTLFCPGIPGAGKTVLTSIVVNELNKRYNNDTTTGIAYIYCNFRRLTEQTAHGLLSSLLRQLAQGQSPLPPNIKSLYDRHKTRVTRPSLNEISESLNTIASMYSRVFIIVDALDECQASDGARSRLLSEVFSLQGKVGVNFFATSRPAPYIEKEFKNCVSLEIFASDEDVGRYIDGHMSELPAFVSGRPDLQEEIKIEITASMEGMFLLAQLYLGLLQDKTSARELKNALRELHKQNKGESPEDRKLDALAQAYKHTMERIDGQKAGFRWLAKTVLSWITCATRPLHTLELQHALAVNTGDRELDEENLREVEDMVSVCAGLVTVDKESSIIRLVHYTTQEYFEKMQSELFPHAQGDIAGVCITYLSFDEFEAGLCQTTESFEARLAESPLYDYAARSWGYHLLKSSTDVEELVLDFLESTTKVSASSQAMMTTWYYSGQRTPRQMTGVHLAAYFGLADVMICLLKRGHDPNAKDSYHRTPLWWAVNNEHEAVVELLLKTNDIDLNAHDTIAIRAPLRLAISRRNESIMKLLLAKDGIDADSRGRNGHTPLSFAVNMRYEAAVKLLLVQDGVDLNARDDASLTPLLLATLQGNEAMVELLLREDLIEPNCKDNDGQTPLFLAASKGYKKMVGLLLARDGINPGLKSDNGSTPLSRAAEYGHEAIVELLLAKGGVDQNTKVSALWVAASEGYEPIARLLLMDNGISPCFKDTALFAASLQGHKAIVELLLGGKDGDPRYKNRALRMAAVSGEEEMLKLLLAANGVEPDFKDAERRTPLSLAVGRKKQVWTMKPNYDMCIELLLADERVDVNSRDATGRTPLSWAAGEGHETGVEILLTKNGIDLDSMDYLGRTPLLWSMENGYEKIERSLTEKGAIVPNDYYGIKALFLEEHR